MAEGDNGRTSEVLRNLAVFGITDLDAGLSNVRPFRLSTMQEIIINRSVVMRNSGLPFSGFAENPWGFPFIPYPVDRNLLGDGRLLLAPDTISFTWLGHPIFWIDPELTAPVGDEQTDPSRWCVRMFYLIMALGLWDVEDLTWYNAPRTRGVNYTEADYRNYLQGYQSSLDGVKFTARDLLVPFEEVARQTEVALSTCEDLQQKEWNRFRTEQLAAYKDATGMLQTDGGPWQDIEDELAALSAEVAGRVDRNEALSDLVPRVYEVTGRLVSLLGNMDRVSMILNSSVTRDNVPDQVAYTRVAASLRLYTSAVVEGGYQRTLDAAVQQLFSLDSVMPAQDFARLHQEATNLHLDAWRRLKVATVNFIRAEQGEQPYDSYAEMQMMDALGGDDMGSFPTVEEIGRGLGATSLLKD